MGWPPDWERLIDGVCLAFAAWTLLCQTVVFLGGNLHHLLAAAVAAVAAAAAGLARWHRRVAARRPSPDPFTPWLWVLCALAALVTLVANRPDHDDAVYMGFATGVADFPGLPLLRYDTLYGIPGLPISLSIYKVQSIEVLYGALSYLLGIPALAASHLLSAPFWGAMVPLSYARLFRAVDRRRWFWGVLAVTLFLVLDGSGHGGYGNLAFVRMFQGKGPFLSVFAPLIAAYALGYSERPARTRWLLLAAALVGAVGMSSTSVWAGPLLALLALAAASRSAPRATAAGAAAALYPLGLGLCFRAAVHAGASEGMALAPGMEWPLLRQTMAYVLGAGTHHRVLLAAILTAPFVSWPGSGARLAAMQAAAFFAFLFNPVAAPWVALNLTSIPAFYRVFWILPVPLTVGLLAMGAADRARRRPVRVLAALALLGCLVPDRLALSRADGTRLDWPGLKVPLQYPLVHAVNAGVPPGSRVLAPLEVSDWMVTENRHAFPILVKPARYDAITALLGPDEIARRERLQAYLGGEHPARLTPEELRRALGDYDPQGVCFLAGLPWAREIRAELISAGMRPRLSLYGYEFWTRAVVQS